MSCWWQNLNDSLSRVNFDGAKSGLDLRIYHALHIIGSYFEKLAYFALRDSNMNALTRGHCIQASAGTNVVFYFINWWIESLPFHHNSNMFAEEAKSKNSLDAGSKMILVPNIRYFSCKMSRSHMFNLPPDTLLSAYWHVW